MRWAETFREGVSGGDDGVLCFVSDICVVESGLLCVRRVGWEWEWEGIANSSLPLFLRAGGGARSGRL